ncbi:MAG TPA: PAS-domain containing protein [Gammaproteobacteria bacterium]|nr:PAS-domain containing protein [Gammaproteobacteria bacterium]
MTRFSIFTRLVFLSVVLIGVLLASNTLLSRALSRNAEALAAEAEIIEALRVANTASKAFGDLKYWLTDLAVSLLMLSEQQVNRARTRVDEALEELRRYDAETAAAVEKEVEALYDQGMKAVDAYTEDRRVIGNSLMAASRVHIAAVDAQLGDLVDRFQADAIVKRDAALAGAEQAVDQSFTIVWVASLIGLVLAWLVLRSITVPLGRLVGAMSAITAGKLDAEIPSPGHDEIGAMTKTLALFRDSLAERDRLAAEQARAETEARHAQERLLTAIESISEGFSLYDSDDRLVVFNTRYREILYPGMEDLIVKGTPFETIVRRAAANGLIRDALGRREAWVKERLASHRSPPRVPSIQRRSDGRWIRVNERKTDDGGTVAVYTDITEEKQSEEQLRLAKEQAERALEELTQAQQSLLHAEKMASLGQLTAGVAHEIKNPLNFVNNFAGLSIDLFEELREAVRGKSGSSSADHDGEVTELIDTIGGNLTKIKEHGGRADRIVTSMLSHARGGAGSPQATDLNALIDESLNLAYHGERARDHSFNISIERQFDPGIGKLDLYRQEMTRVFINLITNGFYATQRRKDELGEPDYVPTLTVRTQATDDRVELRIRDNGIGMPASVREKVFEPFFTTKPPGEGTGLGLSLTYDIVVQQHRGQIEVQSEEGKFTEVIVSLPPQTDHLAMKRGSA